MFSFNKYLILNLVFSHLSFWSGNFFLVVPFPEYCLLLLPKTKMTCLTNGLFQMCQFFVTLFSITQMKNIDCNVLKHYYTFSDNSGQNNKNNHLI